MKAFILKIKISLGIYLRKLLDNFSVIRYADFTDLKNTVVESFENKFLNYYSKLSVRTEVQHDFFEDFRVEKKLIVDLEKQTFYKFDTKYFKSILLKLVNNIDYLNKKINWSFLVIKFETRKKIKKSLLIFTESVVIAAWILSPFAPSGLTNVLPTKEAQAASTYQFTPTGGRLVRGTATSTQALLAAAVEGVNTGSWKGTLADDNMHWVASATTSSPSGFDIQLDMAGVNLNGANKFMIETGYDLDSANTLLGQVPLTFLQICDWASATGVDARADANCTTGGWRTLNHRKIPIVATSTENSFHYEIYDGYFSDGQGNSYSTPLANFIDTTNNNTVTFRYYTDTQTNQSIAIDFLRLYAFVSPTYMPSATVTAGLNGSTTSTPPGLWVQAPTTSNIPYDSDIDNQYIYTVGNNATPDWYIEKRLKSGGLNGSVTGATASRDARSLALNGTYMYVVGDDQGPSWRIEKRVAGSGAGYAAFGTADLSFGTAGIVTSASGTPMRIAIDSTSMYVVGGSAGDWRIEKRNLSNGALNGSFGSSGVVTGAAATATSTAIYIDSSYMYLVGTDTTGWRIEKRNLSDGALVTAFDTDGIITGGAGAPNAITGDGLGNIYITGNNGSGDWRIEKRDATTGALDGTFGSGTGVITSVAGNISYGIDISGSNMYVIGDDATDWRLEKRDLTNGALVGGFGTSGVVTGTSTTVTAYTVESDATYLYLSGTQTGTDWRYEQRNISDGAATPGYGYIIGDVVNVNTPTAGASDNVYLSATSTAAFPIPDFYMKFKNIKTYSGMNSILMRPEVSCSATTPDITYSFSLYNNASTSWESVTGPIDCSVTDFTPVFSKYAPTGSISNYINGSNEIWMRMNFASTSINSNLRIDQIYMTLGSVNENSSAAQVTFGTETAGRVTSNPSSPGNDRILDMESDATYLYLAGYNGLGGDDRWRVEKRLKTTGALDTGFGLNGVVTSDPTVNSDQAQAITQDGTYMYIAGYEGTAAANLNWRTEKRNLSDGALVTAFGNNGVATSAPSGTNDIIYDVKVDANSIYLIGYQNTANSAWRIEKRDIVTGSLCDNSPGTECGSAGAFDTDGIYTSDPGVNIDIAYDSIILGSNIYIVGQDATVSATDIRWRVEARNTATGAAMAGFGTSGATTTNFSANSDIAFDIETDGTSLFVGGWDGVISGTDLQMRILKMNATTGASVTAFGANGSTNYNPANDFDQVTRMRYYNNNLYFTAYEDDDAGRWYTRSISATTAASSTNFNGTTGLVYADDSGDDRPTSLEVDASGVYLAGWGTGPGNNQWMIEKRDPATGLLDSTFGGAGVAGTRTINFTDAVNRDSWSIQAAEENNTFGNDYYAFDNDATSDTTIEEAKAATLDFPVTLPTNASVVSNFYAANFMAGTTGTVRFGLRDYSGFTGSATGGRILIGPTGGATNAMTYDDHMESALLLANGGYNGVINNPEDNIDTKNNRMTMSFVTTVAVATTTKAVMMIDFAFVSIGWVDSTPAGPTGITISGTLYESDESTPFATTTPIKLVISGATSYTTNVSSGTFAFTSVTAPSNGDIVTIWLDTNGGTQATVVFEYGAVCTSGNCTGVNLYKNKVVIDSKNSSTLTNSSLSACDNNSGSACGDTDIGFTSDSGNLNLTWPINTLRLPNSSSKFAPGGTVVAQNFHQSSGEFNGGSQNLTFSGDFILAGGIATSTSATLRVRGDWVNSATYKHNNGIVEIDPLLFDGFSVISGMTATGTKSFYDLKVLKPGATVRFTSGENLYVEHDFRFEGNHGNPSRIRATTPDSKWFLYVGNNALVNFASVRDSGCVFGTVEIYNTPTALNFGGNGPCWHFIFFGGGGGGGPQNPQDDPNAGDGGGSGQGGGGQGGGGCSAPIANAILTSDSVTSVNMVFGGSCFAAPPQVIFTGGGGSGAVAHAIVTNGHVSSVVVDNGGSGYSSPPTISFVGEGGDGGGSGQGGGGQGGGGGAAP